MKKMFFGVLLVVISLALSAQEGAVSRNNGHTLSLGASAGVLYGQSEEIVYLYQNTGTKLSQLLWDLKPLVYAGADVNYRSHKPANRWGVFSDVSFKIGLPMKSGVMEDRDWIALDYPQWLTHYSVHDNYTETGILVDADMGLSVAIMRPFLLKAYLSYSLMYFSWRAKGGSFLYPVWDINNDGEPDGEHAYYTRPVDVITYQQAWHIVSPGIAFYGEFNRYFNAEIAFKASPLVWCITVDDHILRNFIITDILDIGLFIEPSLLFSFTPSDFFTLSLGVQYRNISLIRGDSTYKETGEPAWVEKNIGGAGYSVLDAGIVATFRLFHRP
ncbi:MAG: omptin family outer membrane protease [Spirochaetaceae bacterium]|jgi:outer membrane protease|nr:omptin family outer membrane protease [Spirochaetaceae bacterium]